MVREGHGNKYNSKSRSYYIIFIKKGIDANLRTKIKRRKTVIRIIVHIKYYYASHYALRHVKKLF